MEEGRGTSRLRLKTCKIEISDKDLIGRRKSGSVTIEFQMGLLRERLLVGEREYEVSRGQHGWTHVVDPRGGAGRVRYDGWRDQLFIESPVGSLQIQFRLRNTTFDWAGRTYRITPMIWGRLTILEGDRPVVEYRSTGSGVRQDCVGPDFQPIERELAIGFSQRFLGRRWPK